MEVNKENKTIKMTRMYDYSRQLVWDTSTNPKLIPEWWGPSQYKTTVDKMNMVVGGEWRFVQVGEDGREEGFHGEYKEIDAPNSFTWTFEYEGMPGHVITETYMYEPVGENQTKITTVSTFESLEDLEGMLATGMEGGANETMERLEALLAKQK